MKEKEATRPLSHHSAVYSQLFLFFFFLPNRVGVKRKFGTSLNLTPFMKSIILALNINYSNFPETV